MSLLTLSSKLLLLAGAVLIQGCSRLGTPENLQYPSPSSNAQAGTVSLEANFQNISAQILQPSCVSCHSGYSTESGIAGDLVAGSPDSSSIYNMVATGRMPRNAAKLSDDKIALLRRYITGLSSRGRVVTEPTPTPTSPSASPSPVVTLPSSPSPSDTPTSGPVQQPTPVVSNTPAPIINFAAIKTAILTPSCLMCHSANNEEGLTPLESLSDVRENISMVQRLITRNRMPPTNFEGRRPGDAEKSMLDQWVRAGMPE